MDIPSSLSGAICCKTVLLLFKTMNNIRSVEDSTAGFWLFSVVGLRNFFEECVLDQFFFTGNQYLVNIPSSWQRIIRIKFRFRINYSL